MKYPSIAKQPRRSVSVPALSGGVNLRDSISMINDNQLTECKNLWENGGVLETRPPCKAFSQYIIGRHFSDETTSDFKTFPHIKKDNKILCSCKKMYTASDTYHEAEIYFWWQCENNYENAGCVYQHGFLNEYDCNWFVVEKNGTLYCYVSNNEGYGSVFINKYNENSNWTEILENEYYIPLVASGCKSLGLKEYSETDSVEGTQVEGYNLIGGYYKMQYTKVNRELCSSNGGRHFASFKLLHPFEVEDNWYGSNKTLKLKYVTALGATIEYEVLRGNNRDANGWYYASAKNTWSYYLAVKGNTVKICDLDNDGNTTDPICFQDTDYVCENDLEIIAPYTKDIKNLSKVFKMTQSEWFGGSAKGINGGAHLFLTGNTAENEGALVIWSGLNDPLYFSENNHTYVGNKSQKATAFGKQGENLVIFKENETYYTCYQENDDITGDDLINQNVTDLSASSVYFPMVLINGTIGCDCPDTVQLCRNRLVWAHSCGKVYTLSSENQYSERTIFEVSEMIGPRLKTESGKLKKATSADFEGHYMLFVENRVYLMSYNSYGYQYVYSFSKNEDANLKIPWYMWELPLFTLGFDLGSYQYPAASVINDRLVLISFYNAKVAENVSMMAFSINPEEKDTFDRAFSEYGDKTAPIESYLQTKIFDFGAPNYRKNIDIVQLSLGNNNGVPIEIQYITDSGSEAETIVLSDGDTEPRSAAYVTSVTLNPCIKSVVRFGMKLSCKGTLAVDNMSLHYRLLGGAR